MEEKSMHKLLEKKKKRGDGELSDLERDAKMGVVKEMRDQASSMMGDRLKGLKKVTVASNDKHGLEEGLSKAKELLEGGQIDEDAAEHPEEHDENQDHALHAEEEANEGRYETPEEEELDEENCSPEEIDAKIARLHELKARKEKHSEGY